MTLICEISVRTALWHAKYVTSFTGLLEHTPVFVSITSWELHNASCWCQSSLGFLKFIITEMKFCGFGTLSIGFAFCWRLRYERNYFIVRCFAVEQKNKKSFSFCKLWGDQSFIFLNMLLLRIVDDDLGETIPSRNWWIHTLS